MSIIPKFIQNFLNWIKGLVKKVTPEVKQMVQIGIDVVENMKNYVNDPKVDVLTALIPGNVDDAAVRLMRSYLPKILAELQFIKGRLDNDQIIEFIDKLQHAGEDASAIFKHGIASAVNNLITDDIGSMSQAFMTTEVVFKSDTEELKAAT